MLTPITGCTCGAPGWCERHQCEKDGFDFQRCQRQPVCFALWESGALQAARQRRAGHLPTCALRGEVLRMVDCEGCRGAVKIKVYACELFDECTVQRTEGIERCCDGCAWHRPPSRSAN